MDIERLKQKLNGFSSKVAVNNDTFLKINIESTNRLLPPGEINKTVNLGDRFDTERNRSTFYRILGSINPTMANPLFNLTDSTFNDNYTWATFNNLNFLDTSYPKDNDVADKTDLIYSTSIKKNLVEKDGWYGHFDPDKTKSGLCYFFDMEPKRERFSFIPDMKPFHPTPAQIIDNGLMVKNWELLITYPASADTTHKMVAGGLLIVEAISVTTGNRLMTAFGMPCKHNLSIGDVVKITGTTNYNGTHVVVRTGLDNGDLKEYYFVLDIPTGGTVGSNSRMIKVINGFDSKYYFRQFKKIKTKQSPIIETDDYETYPLGFSENIYYDKMIQFSFNEDIDIDGLTDNLNRPLSQLYLTIIKTDSNELFSNISSGLETPFIEKFNTSDANQYLKDIPIINKIHNGTGANIPFITHKPLELNVSVNNNNSIVNNNLFYGDLVEFNENTLNEVVLSEVNHRFNTRNRESLNSIQAIKTLSLTPAIEPITLGPRQEGYYYKAHHLMQIRQFSNYIETGDVNTGDMPDYTINLGDGRYVWRDLLDLGFSETTIKVLDYPFLNDSHYLYQNYCFYLKRQDPFNMWDLFHTNYPSDPIGQKITNKFIINSEEDVC